MVIFSKTMANTSEHKIKSFTIEQKHFNNGSTHHQIGSSLNHRQINVTIMKNAVFFVKIYKFKNVN